MIWGPDMYILKVPQKIMGKVGGGSYMVYISRTLPKTKQKQLGEMSKLNSALQSTMLFHSLFHLLFRAE